MFGEIIREVVCAFTPVDEKMSLFDAIANPIKTHIHCFRTSLFDSFIADAGGAGIVGLNRSCWLWMPHVFECGAEHGGFFAIEEESTEFGFGGGGKDGGHDGGMDVDGAVGGRRSGVGRGGTEGIDEGIAEEEETACAGASLFFGEV